MPAINLKSVSFKTLSSLSIKQRMKAFNSPDGRIIFSLLTPTQFAALFPTYYKQQLPDISGFMKALPTSYTQAKQKMYEQQMEQTVSGAKEGRAMGDLDESTRTATVRKYDASKKDQSKPSITEGQAYAATPEELAAFKKVQSGPIEATSTEAKVIGQLSADNLAALHVEKYIDPETKKEMYRYSAPKATPQEAENMLRRGGSSIDQLAKIVPNIKNDPALAAELGVTAKKLGVTPASLALMLKVENPALNPSISGGAGGRFSGLYQMGSGELSSVGVTPEQFRKMSSVEQTRVWTEWMQKIDFKGRANLTEGDTNQNFTMLQANQLGSGRNLKNINPNSVLASGQAPQIGSDTTLNSLSDYARRNNPENIKGDQPEEPKGPGGTYTDEQIKAQQKRMDEAKPGEDLNRAARYYMEMHKANANKPNATQITPIPTKDGKFDYESYYKEVSYDRITGKTLNIAAGEKDIGKYGGKCGRGVANAIGHMFGDKSFLEIGGMDAGAFSMNGRSNRLEKSGLYKDKTAISDEQIAELRKNPRSVPPGTVIAVGQAGGVQHIQYFDGRNWISDTVQRNINMPRPDERGSGAIFYPSDVGIARLPKEIREASKDTIISYGYNYDKLNSEGNTNSKEENVKAFNENTPPITTIEQTTISGLDVGQEGKATTTTTAAAAPQPARYNFSEAAFEGAVRGKYGILASAYDRAGLVSEFKSKLPPGVSYEKGVLTIKDPNDPAIKEVMDGLEKEFGKKTVSSVIQKIEEKKPEPVKQEVKPVVQAPAPAPTTQQPEPPKTETPTAASTTPTDTNKPRTLTPEEMNKMTPAQVMDHVGSGKKQPPPTTQEPKKEEPKKTESAPAPAPEPPKKEEPKKEPPPPAHAGGGKEKVDGPLSYADISPQRGDNTLVTDTGGNQFTMNRDKEVMQVNPNTNVVDIKPTSSATIQAQSKVASDVNPIRPVETAQPTLTPPMENLDQRGPEMTGSMGKRSRTTNDLQPNRSSNMIPELLDQSRQTLKNPSAMRAFARAAFGETGDVLDGNKHSYGNNNVA